MTAALVPAVLLLVVGLPTPPKKVVLDAPRFGKVTLDHTLHLNNRAPCAACHGEGPVGKISREPKGWHEACRGCHRELERGPIECRGCHAKPAGG
jgi:hypothetical protein